MADDLEDLDGAVRRHDPDRWLATRFIGDAQARADVIALYAFNYELTRIPGAVSNPLMGEIRLTWWGEVLSEIYEARPVRRHPVALALAEAVQGRSLPRVPLEAMIEARYPELDGAAPDMLKTELPLIALTLAVLGESVPHNLGGIVTGSADAKTVSTEGFPAVAHLSLKGREGASALARRLRITWAALTGRL